MQTREPASSSAGRVRRLGSLLLALMCSACVHAPADWVPPLSPLEFWDQAVSGSEVQRELMWRDAQERGVEWRLALLQSVPGYRRYDPVAARRGLQAAIDAFGRDDIAAVARLVIADMQADRACEQRTLELKQRLMKVIAIEERMDNDGR